MKTIIWDIDDVLNDLMRDWLELHWKKKHPDCDVLYDEIVENPPHRLLNISFEDYIHSLDEFRVEKSSFMQPVPEIKEWFRINGKNFRHIALTATPMSLATHSAAWLFKHFHLWFRSFNVAPSPREDGVDPSKTTKKNFLEWLGKGDIIIDDNPFNIREVRDIGIETLLFPRPWNSSKLSIKEALELLNELLQGIKVTENVNETGIRS